MANILHIGYSSAPPVAADLSSLAAAVQTSLDTNLHTLYCAELTQTEVIATDLSSDSAAVGSASVPWSGYVGTGFVSAGSAILVNWSIGRRYRGGKPRTYWPALPAVDLETPSTWSDGTVAAIVAAMTGFKADIEAHTFGDLVTTSLGCVSYRSGNLARVDPVFEPFTSFSVGTLVRSQRRRITASSF